MQPTTFFWHRRDLRIDDNAGLYHALKHSKIVQPLFIFDTNILDKLEDKTDKRVQFIHQEIEHLNNEYAKHGGSLLVKYGDPQTVWQELVNQFNIQAVYTNRDYEPYAQQRDKAVYDFLKNNGIPFKGFKDHVIFEKNEVLKKDGKPYTVYTPYSKIWKTKVNDFYYKSYPTLKYIAALKNSKAEKILSLQEMGFTKTQAEFPSRRVDWALVENYHNTRNLPAIKGTTQLSIHLRFGTISIRQLAQQSAQTNQTYLNELIWRDFYQMILYHFPMVEKAFKPKYDLIEWRNNETEFAAWCKGQTGYPIVDAGMRELNQTGHMHNRVRMIVASFLTKHLLIDWRWGEAYFAKKLLDFDLASNNGGWQWAAGSGCDAAPYFRVFNPYTQTDKFDKQFEYIKKWVPEYDTPEYPKPIVEHKFARERALATYKAGLAKAENPLI